MEKNLRFWLPMLLIMQIIQMAFMTYLLSPAPTLEQLKHAQAVIIRKENNHAANRR